jgi:RNA polymerase sigma factor (sigma-70 family)
VRAAGRSAMDGAHGGARPTNNFVCDFQAGGCYKVNMTPDCELLRCYAETRSEAAFAELVQRHVNLVYSAALRQVNGDAYLAQDVAQTVFTDLARKAAALSRRATLAGWLYTSAHFAAARAARTENRRRNREEQFMREPTLESAPAADWEKLRPVLDDAMHELKEADREAVLLRYFENRQFAEVGAKLGLNENAARMRVERALEKLRTVFQQRGVAATTTLASVISANAIQVAPVGLAGTLTTSSLAGAGAGTFALLKIMTATQVKLGVTALAVAGAATVMVVQQQAQKQQRTDNASLQQQLAQLQTDNESLSNRLAATGDARPFSSEQMNELLKLRGEVGALRRQNGELGKLREENHQLQRRTAPGQNQTAEMSPDEQQFEASQAETINAMKFFGLASRLYAGDHHDQYATNFDQMKDQLGPAYTNLPLESFEFVNAGLVNDTLPDKIIFRERTPRQKPGGGWTRIYCLADGSVQTITSADGNFDFFEREHMVAPPANQ